MFTCRDACELMTDEREGALKGWTAFKYRMHMAVCVSCRRCRRQTDTAVALAHEIPPAREEEVPEQVLDSALAAFRARSSK